MVTAGLVLDASAWVDLLINDEVGQRISRRVEGHVLRAPAHIDVEMLSAFGRLVRAGEFTEQAAAEGLIRAQRTLVERQPLPMLSAGAWARRHSLRISDAYYVELATRLDVPLITTDQRLARAAPIAEVPG